ncbi:MAG TPA: MBL fold metallo-hydrolase [Steroidobacteraceae bacterium]|nr:MBL fold metallo-hydrolase [Steroidobacteraceae bacterium]
MLRRSFHVIAPLAFATVASLANADSLPEVAKALGAEGLTSLEFSASGYDYALGQAPDVNAGYPKFNVKSYRRIVSFAPWATSLQRVRTQLENPPRGGGGQPIVGEQTQTQSVAAGSAAASTLPVELASLAPQAFVKAAQSAADAKVEKQSKQGKQYTVVSFTASNKAKTVGWINDKQQLVGVQTSIDNPVLGDVKLDTEFADYRQFNGVPFPAHIVQKQNGATVLDLKVSDVKRNVPVEIQATPPSATTPLAAEKLSDGVYLITGGYAAVVVGFDDHITVIEGGQNEKRSEEVIAEAKRLIPGKPITEVVNTHPHFDHAGGLRTYVAEGATILTHESNKGFFEKTLVGPRTLTPDRQSQQPKPVKVRYLGEKTVLRDVAHVIELHHLQNFTHHEGTLVAYLPKEKVLVQADGFNPPAAPLTATPAVVSPYQLQLANNIERLQLQVDRIIPIHLPADGRKVTLAELWTAVGKTSAQTADAR